MGEPRTYINATCKIGQREACGREATYAIAVTGVADNAWMPEMRKGGIVTLCEYHATTPIAGWTPTHPAETLPTEEGR